jgi:hypothetical protein
MPVYTADWPRLTETSSSQCCKDRVGSRVPDVPVPDSRPRAGMACLTAANRQDTLSPKGALIVQTTPVAT